MQGTEEELLQVSHRHKALIVLGPNQEAQIESLLIPQLKPEEVLIQTHYSSLNYKDALAVTGKGRILRSFPLTPGIDSSGVVTESRHSDFKKGDVVLVTGTDLGETRNGGFAETMISPGHTFVKIPPGLDTRSAMIIGTAGFTAALAILRMETNGQRPDLGPILVSGASGGVGQFATHLLSQKGYEVWALSQKKDKHRRLMQIGAKKCFTISDLKLGSRPLETIQFGGVIDNIGGDFLGKVMSHVTLWGNVASVGLAQSPQLSISVMPHILRGVSLIGVSSNNCPMPTRIQIWKDLAYRLDSNFLESILESTITLEHVVASAYQILNQKSSGRTLVQTHTSTY